MPNWVFNTLHISGNAEDLSAFRAEMSKPFTTYYADTHYDKEKQEWVKTPAVQEHTPVFALWNILSPDPSDYDEYFAVQARTRSKTPIDDPNWWADTLAHQAVSKHWYDWNLHHWGTKWDVHHNVKIIDESEPTHFAIRFETAWSSVIDLLCNVLSPRFPNLTFCYEYEEEQGWGGEWTFKDGDVIEGHEWDIPESHADYESLDKTCPCYQEEDPLWWYEDCPKAIDGGGLEAVQLAFNERN